MNNQEEKKIVIEIKNWVGTVLFKSEKKTTKEAVEDAVLSEANLSEADLSEADLSEAELNLAKFYGKGGITRIRKSQVEDFFKALGVVVED